MFNLRNVIGHLTKAKQPAPIPIERYLAELATGQISEEAFQKLQEWDRQEREAISRSLDELMAQMPGSDEEAA